MNRYVEIRKHGGVEELSLVHADRAETRPGLGEIRVRHRAIGLNFTDVYQRMGSHPVKFSMPLRLGMEGAGVVEEVGPGVDHLVEGDRVAYATHPPGSYCDVRVMAAQNVCRLPDSISFETGAAMMLKGLTAQYLLKQCVPLDGLRPGSFVLFHAAAGGVGLILCQWAKLLGFRVIATCGSEQKCRTALQNGAEFAINYTNESFSDKVLGITGGKGVRVVYDAVGRDTFTGSLRSLSCFGLLVSFGNASGVVPPIDLGEFGAKSLYVTRQTLFNFTTSREKTQRMADDLFAVVASGAVKIHIAQRFSLEDIQGAHRMLEARGTIGSTVITL